MLYMFSTEKVVIKSKTQHNVGNTTYAMIILSQPEIVKWSWSASYSCSTSLSTWAFVRPLVRAHTISGTVRVASTPSIAHFSIFQTNWSPPCMKQTNWLIIRNTKIDITVLPPAAQTEIFVFCLETHSQPLLQVDQCLGRMLSLQCGEQNWVVHTCL